MSGINRAKHTNHQSQQRSQPSKHSIEAHASSAVKMAGTPAQEQHAAAVLGHHALSHHNSADRIAATHSPHQIPPHTHAQTTRPPRCRVGLDACCKRCNTINWCLQGIGQVHAQLEQQIATQLPLPQAQIAETPMPPAAGLLGMTDRYSLPSNLHSKHVIKSTFAAPNDARTATVAW